MNIKLGLFGLTITSAFLVMVSCSGSSESDSSSGGSSSTSAGSAGKATGGGSTTAGTSNNSSGTSNNGNGGTANNNGGSPSSNGGFTFGGNFNFGGAGFDPADFMCNPKPTVGSACAAGTQPCADGSTVCFCQQTKWACIDLGGGEGGAPGGGFGQLDCPMDKPMSGDKCDGIGVCPYGGMMMGCACFGGTWTCN